MLEEDQLTSNLAVDTIQKSQKKLNIHQSITLSKVSQLTLRGVNLKTNNTEILSYRVS